MINDTNEVVDNELLDIYFEEIGKIKRLNQDDIKEYSSSIRKWLDTPKAGGKTTQLGKEAREALILGNLRLVIVIAQRYRNLGLDFSDLISEGNIGLMKAVDRFSPNRGSKFSYYASFWIRQAIRKALSIKGRTIRLPKGAIEEKIKILKFIDSFEGENGREPSKEEIMIHFEITTKKLKALLEMGFQSRSINEITIEKGEEFGDLIVDTRTSTPVENLLNKEKDQILNTLLKKLDKKQRFILKNRFGLDGVKRRTLESIGKDLNVTRERIRQIEVAILKKLRKMYRENEEA